MIRITDIKLELSDALNSASELDSLKKYIVLNYRMKDKDILSMSIYKKAVDARKKDHVHFVYSVDLEVTNEQFFLNKDIKGLSEAPVLEYQEIDSGSEILHHPPIIIGFGPSGIFSALLLARRGYKPIVLERGYDVEKRSKNVDHFYETGEYTEGSTILFGEGGAGTFSDGKLTTLISDLRCRFVLQSLVKGGAQHEILYINKPHVGTDVLRVVIKNIRQEIIRLGGQVRFDSKVTEFIIENNTLKGVIVNNQDKIETSICLLGIGHSARDTFQVLYNQQVEIIQKAFSIGVRIEHPQSFINQSQYGKFSTAPNLGAADYKLSYHATNQRSAYTFCMCPGGWVMCASSEEGGVVTNGMSESKRDYENANSALLVNVNPEDFGSAHPLAGVDFQRKFEQKAFILGGSNYNAPIQLVGDFLNDQPSKKLGSVNPSYRPGFKFVKMTDIFPSYITDTMKEALIDFNRKIKGFTMHDAILTGVETRSSSPIRILRNENHQSNIHGLYPMGEGAGYAGGIMSSAVDGIKTAEKVIAKYQSID
ncbi:MAG: hypothetical protein A2084_03450 [Tenericutes bacterium GWC2_39_45]|nr:MAG: hypothetical protein A2Y43_00555 [Tenericutes bacterium GWA2_38_26]OHE30499.1 MAG: hypothetical protein A2084_03450 [Tenericutes bacterium GWC2_39_45]OHE32648.1 MAG: hypothetical protein A2009_06030 [Tenericutes bacterium GWD2_38_27]OHE45436.1 MAG: hypothetical protein A2102_06210 [Tenericutes bacterium GWF2_38_8]HBG32252.1 hypothetical protein [Acholeplasmataceae bacterium]